MEEKDIDTVQILTSALGDICQLVAEGDLSYFPTSYALRMATVNAAKALGARTQLKMKKANGKLVDSAIWLLLSMSRGSLPEYGKDGNPGKLDDEITYLISGCAFKYARHSWYDHVVIWDVLLAVLIMVGPEEFPKLLRERWVAGKWL